MAPLLLLLKLWVRRLLGPRDVLPRDAAEHALGRRHVVQVDGLEVFVGGAGSLRHREGSRVACGSGLIDGDLGHG